MVLCWFYTWVFSRFFPFLPFFPVFFRFFSGKIPSKFSPGQNQPWRRQLLSVNWKWRRQTTVYARILSWRRHRHTRTEMSMLFTKSTLCLRRLVSMRVDMTDSGTVRHQRRLLAFFSFYAVDVSTRYNMFSKPGNGVRVDSTRRVESTLVSCGR